jgi:hypothetical protein
MVTRYQFKEANRYYWIVKGMLIPDSWSDKDIMSMYNSYMERIWHNHEASSVHSIDFEAAWKAKEAKDINNGKSKRY